MRSIDSPLRYPGGKAFLKSEFERIIATIGLRRPTYVEPYAGGAGAALALLFADKVSKIVINDYDKAIYAFWRSVTREPERFARKILRTPVTLDEWKKQKKIYDSKSNDEFALGFATFFLNRTNRSGVMNAWPIGGEAQKGEYKIDARFNKKVLAARVRKIGRYAHRIVVSRQEGIALTKQYLTLPNTFIYLDPPYFKKGAMLYKRHYDEADHRKLAKLLNRNANRHWLLTYDERVKIRDMYPRRARKRMKLSYRVQGARMANELMIFSNTTAV